MAASDYSQAVFCIIDPMVGVGVGPPTVSETDTRQLFNLNQTVLAEDKNTGGRYCGVGEFVYVRGSNVTARGQFVQIVNGSAILLDSNNSASFYPVGLAAGALSATNVYGWVQVAGLADYATCSNTAVAVGVRLCLGSTAGQVGTVTGIGSRIAGIIPASSYAAARSASSPNLTVQLQRPMIWGITDSN